MTGDYIIETSAAVGWNHDWSESWSTKLSLEYMDNEYNVLNRTDTSRIATAELSHQMLRWLKLTAFAQLEDRNSSVAAIGSESDYFRPHRRVHSVRISDEVPAARMDIGMLGVSSGSGS